MIKENQRILNAILVIIDIIVILISLGLAYFVRFKTTIFSVGGSLPFSDYFIFTIVCIIPTYILLYYFFGLYKPFRNQSSIFSGAEDIVKSDIMAFIILVAILFIINQPNFSRIMLLLLSLFGMILTIAERVLVVLVLRMMRTNNLNLKHMLIIGDNDLAFEFAHKINSKTYLGYNIAGFLGRKENIGKRFEGTKFIGSFDDLPRVLKTHKFDRVVIAIPLKYYYHLNEIVDACEEEGIKAEIIPDYYKYLPAKPSVDMLDDMPIINIRYVPLDDAFNKFKKIVSDYFVSIVAIIITSPIMILTAIAIKIESPGPIIFKQERIGYNGKPFMMYKFRSMKVQDDEEEKSQWTTKDDPRKTRIGTFIRKWSIDELPQFFNVLKRDMSVVGPRPERPYFVEEFKKTIPKYMVKHQVRPGLTGLAQVNGYRGNTSIKKRIEYDIRYVENWSLALDVKIMFWTVFRRNKNAY
ncbi:exopolysaccharide biosynthesis polyprenyl glycosylphosphotransferase [Methanobrevibacter ruminantium M1]|uniref:Exopolysaccharide biosynthesis polyprenyl glycosylphosphotransferase n=1 Tax=Methanobrevibacter ruminantium (strain ATCC 35063 / DSM 1093 / JCM 13430 / OCM 146 / M1) TaxID=634498 RepID=D3DYP5_METRM|nr:undecaprenyl-phosphate glucose phosphotransferase [Methanobrevibacter ruminantium]ADC45965.1 exopolysaccharide biosynthesis polyprenyl glycosylphosphotransferase [Methanobrevibacter ruminantium M1]